MKNFKFIPYFCLLLLFLTGFNTAISAQSYVSNSEASYRVRKTLVKLEDRYSQLDRQREKPISKNKSPKQK